MADALDDGADIKDTDIVFDCPYCGKSLAIDYRGAGLTIPCSDCGKSVEVPIPEGMEISDVDSTEEEQEIRILNLRRSLSLAEARIEELEARVSDLTHRRDELEKRRTANLFRFGTISERVGVIERSLRDITAAVETISKAATEE